VTVTRDPIDDSTTVGLALLGADLEAELMLMCRRQKLDVLLSWRGRYLGATGPLVWVRLGSQKAEKKRWSLSADHKVAFFPGEPKELVEQLLSTDRLVVQTDHFAQARITDTFDLSGLRTAIEPLKAECRIE
jgi:hypothetical protein